MFGAIAILFVLPWLDTSKVRSMRYRPFASQLFVVFVVACIGLGFCGANEPDAFVFKTGKDRLQVEYSDTAGKSQTKFFDQFSEASAFKDPLPAAAGPSLQVAESGFKWKWLSQILGAYYFIYFLVLLPLLGVVEKPKPRPASIADSVHKRSGSGRPSGAPAAAPQHAE